MSICIHIQLKETCPDCLVVDNAALKQEIEQLKSDNAALVECVKFYAGFENGLTARACMKQIEGE